MQATIGSSKLEICQTELAHHFEEETRTKKHVHELEQKLGTLKAQSQRFRNEVSDALKLNGRDAEETIQSTDDLETHETQIKKF
jgi:hypothetical protein